MSGGESWRRRFLNFRKSSLHQNNNMPKLFDKNILVYNAQVSLIDKKATDYPQWKSGKEKSVYSDAGVAVATDTDREVRVIISTNPPKNMYFLGTAKIYAGTDGLLVGNELSGDSHHIKWSSGKTKVEIFVDKKDKFPEIIEFVLK